MTNPVSTPNQTSPIFENCGHGMILLLRMISSGVRRITSSAAGFCGTDQDHDQVEDSRNMERIGSNNNLQQLNPQKSPSFSFFP